jgi:hypothetical protein
MNKPLGLDFEEAVIEETVTDDGVTVTLYRDADTLRVTDVELMRGLGTEDNSYCVKTTFSDSVSPIALSDHPEAAPEVISGIDYAIQGANEADARSVYRALTQ